ncbi:MAG: hypothetical protein ACUVV0_15225 [Anaerolineae bacterium]
MSSSHFDYITLAAGLIFLAISVLSVYHPELAWGRMRPDLSAEQKSRLIRRRKIGSVVYFAIGAALLILSTTGR